MVRIIFNDVLPHWDKIWGTQYGGIPFYAPYYISVTPTEYCVVLRSFTIIILDISVILKYITEDC